MTKEAKMNRKARRVQKALGNLPNAKAGPGEIDLKIGNEGGLIKIDFGKPVVWITMQPDKAEKFAAAILKHVSNIHEGNKKAPSVILPGAELKQEQAAAIESESLSS